MKAVPSPYPLLLLALTLLFGLRVFGQLLVAYIDVAFLPPFERWTSGLVPYPVLLPIQLALIATMLMVVRDFTRGFGFFLSLSPRTGKILVWLSALYALTMVVRYIVTMTWHPELRWFTGTTPIWFHFVLATFLYLVGRFAVRYRQSS
jgi:hypothetical protein